MTNPDPTTFQPPPPLIKEEVFTDPLQPGAEWKFRFIAYPDFTLQAPLQAKRDEYYSTYCDTEDGKLPAKLPPMGDGANRREVVLTWEITQAIALLEVMQHPEEEADRWNFNTWAYFYLAAPNAFEAAANFAGEMIGEAKGKNLPSPDTASVSGHSLIIASLTQLSLTSSSPISEMALQLLELLQEQAA